MFNDETIIIDVDKFDNNEYVNSLFENEEMAQAFFKDSEDFKNFFIEVGKNNPKGISKEYLTQLIQSYAYTKTVKSLIEKGLISECYDEQGNAGYKILERNS